jgi:molecular chaperone GrpE (heat shock protein)
VTGVREPDEPDRQPADVASDHNRLAPSIELADIRALLEAIAALESRVAELVTAANREHERAAFRESVIDRLHGENERLRRGELEALLEPVRGGLFRLHDMARRGATQWRAVPDLTRADGAALLDAVAEEAADVLVGVGVKRFEAVVGEAYDPGRHRPVAATPVAEAWRDNTVAEVRLAGFATVDAALAPAEPGVAAAEPGLTMTERVIRRADVVVARFDPAATGHDDQTGEGSRQR